jgi:tight adherence protein B
MSSFLGGNSFLILTVLILVAVLLLLEGVYLIWRSVKGPQATKLQKRLVALSATGDNTQHTKLLRQRLLSELPRLERYLQRVPRLRGLDGLIVQSGLEWTVSTVFVTCLGLGIFGFTAAFVAAHQPWLTSMVVAIVLGSAPLVYVQSVRSRRLAKIERQLPDALDLLTRALRAGHALPAALKMAGDELADPIGGEFRTVHDEVNFGVSLQQALSHLTERVPITDLRYFVVAVLIQRESGGNLTEILGNLSKLIRDRLKLLARVRVLSSEGRMSAWILCMLPFALGGILYLANPKFISLLWTDPLGMTITKTMLGLMLFGVFLVKKIIKIRV